MILIDDSIVRLNTAPRLVERINNANPLSVSFLVGSPPVMFPDFYGIDTPVQSELAAAVMSIEQMEKEIGVSHLGYLSLKGLVEAIGVPEDRLNLSCFNGVYPIDIGKNNRRAISRKPANSHLL